MAKTKSINFVTWCLFWSVLSHAQSSDIAAHDRIVKLHQQVELNLANSPELSLRYALSARKEVLINNDDLANQQILLDLSICYRYNGEIDSAMRYARLSVGFNSRVPDSLQASIFANIGSVFFAKGLNDSALYFQLRSLKLRELSGSKEGLINSLYNLGAISNSTGDKKQSHYYFTECFKLATISGKPGLIALASEGMASSCYNNASYEKAIFLYKQSERLYKYIGNKKDAARCFMNLGSLYDEIEQPDKSVNYYLKAIAVFKGINQLSEIMLCYSNIGVTYMNINKFDLALSYLQQAGAMAEKAGNLWLLKNNYENISTCYRLKNKPDSALVYFERFTLIKDSILNIEKVKDINLLQESYNKEKREQEIRTLKEQGHLKEAEMIMHRKRNLFLVVALVLSVLLTILIFFVFIQRTKSAMAITKKNEELYRKRIHEVIKEHEIKSINKVMEGQEEERKRIAEDLHDRLGSMLAAVKLHFNAVESKLDKLELKTMEQYEQANQLLDRVCDEVRQIAHNMESGILINFGLIAALTDLQEALIQSSTLDITLSTFGMNERLATSVEINMYRIVQELLSNVIRHSGAEKVSIDLTRNSEQLNLILSDDGKGYDTEDKARKGMGLKNILSRVERMGGIFYVDSDGNKGTISIIEIPLTNDQNIIGG